MNFELGPLDWGWSWGLTKVHVGHVLLELFKCTWMPILVGPGPPHGKAFGLGPLPEKGWLARLAGSSSPFHFIL